LALSLSNLVVDDTIRIKKMYFCIDCKNTGFTSFTPNLNKNCA
jgi:hypothetical protein